MNFKNIVWIIKAISYFVLLRSFGIIIIIIIIIIVIIITGIIISMVEVHLNNFFCLEYINKLIIVKVIIIYKALVLY